MPPRLANEDRRLEAAVFIEYWMTRLRRRTTTGGFLSEFLEVKLDDITPAILRMAGKGSSRQRFGPRGSPASLVAAVPDHR
jgi:hypothetical protein